MKEWTGQSMSSLLRITDDTDRWAAITAEVSVEVSQRRLGLTGITELNTDIHAYLLVNFKFALDR